MRSVAAVFGVVAAVVAGVRVEADAIVVTRAMSATTIAEVFLEDEAVTVELEIGVQDLAAFRNLLPDSLLESMNLQEDAPLSERLPRFFEQDFVLRADGVPLMARIEEMTGRRRVPRDEISGEPLPGQEESGEAVVAVRLVYPLRGLPDTLGLVPPQATEQAPPAVIGFVVYDRGIAVNDFRYLGAEEVLHVDREDPWYSRFDNRNLKRQFEAPLSVFLYVEPFEVRKEVVVRARDLQGWVDLGIEGRDVIPAADQPELKRKAAEFLEGHGHVTIDAEPAEGFLDRIHFIRRSLRRTGVVDPPEDLDTDSAMLGAIFVYPTDGLAREASVEWDLFSDRIRRVPAVATDEAGGLPSFLVPEDPLLLWQNFLTDPTMPGWVEVGQPPTRRGTWLALAVVLGAAVFGLVLVGKTHRAGLSVGTRRRELAAVALAVVVGTGWLALTLRSVWMSDDEVDTIVSGLLQNVYRAFDYREESVIYDTLERSVSGDLLTDIYLETRRGLEIANQGGARAKVKQLELVDSRHRRLGDGPGFVADCTWNVSGSVGHWGHLHQRTNQYEARLTVRSVGGSWKITGLEILGERRL